MRSRVTRREFIAGIAGSAVARRLAASAQRRAIPVVGFLDSRSPEVTAERLRAFRQGLKDGGRADGENVELVYRFAENQVDRLPMLAADLAGVGSTHRGRPATMLPRWQRLRPARSPSWASSAMTRSRWASLQACPGRAVMPLALISLRAR